MKIPKTFSLRLKKRGYCLLFFLIQIFFLSLESTPIEQKDQIHIIHIIAALRHLPQIEYPEKIVLFQFSPLERTYYQWMVDSSNMLSVRVATLAALLDALFTQKFSFLGQQYAPLFRARAHEIIKKIENLSFLLKTGWFSSKRITLSSLPEEQKKLIHFIIIEDLTLTWAKKIEDLIEEHFVRLKAQSAKDFSQKTLKQQTQLVALRRIAQLLQKNSKKELELVQKSIKTKDMLSLSKQIQQEIEKTNPFDLSSYDVTLPAL